MSVTDRTEPGPGRLTARGFGGYTGQQERRWQAVSDVYFAHTGHYLHTRYAAPGRSFDKMAFQTWQQKCIDAWTYEADHRETELVRGSIMSRFRGVDADDLPEHVWLYLYERMLNA